MSQESSNARRSVAGQFFEEEEGSESNTSDKVTEKGAKLCSYVPRYCVL